MAKSGLADNILRAL